MLFIVVFLTHCCKFILVLCIFSHPYQSLCFDYELADLIAGLSCCTGLPACSCRKLGRSPNSQCSCRTQSGSSWLHRPTTRTRFVSLRLAIQLLSRRNSFLKSCIQDSYEGVGYKEIICRVLKYIIFLKVVHIYKVILFYLQVRYIIICASMSLIND